MERIKIVERDDFTFEEKMRISQKSNEKCCHCGRKVYHDGYGATVDHYIPLSKGGTNRDINMVMLCETCNKSKGSKIIPPEDYLKYLNPKDLEKLQGYFDSYIRSFEYISRKNLLSCDAYMIRVAPYIKGAHYTRKAAAKMPCQEMWFKRAEDKDRSKLEKYYKEYLARYELEDKCETVSGQIDFWLTFGCIYYLEKNGEIKTMIAATIRTLKEEMRYEGIERALQLFIFSKYANPQSCFLANAIQQKLAYTFSEEQGFSIMTTVLTVYKNDPMSYRINSALGGKISDGVMEEFDSFVSKYVIYSDLDEEDVKEEEKQNLRNFMDEFADVSLAADEWAKKECNQNIKWLIKTIKDEETDFVVETPSGRGLRLKRRVS